MLLRPPAVLGSGESSVWNALRPEAVRRDEAARHAVPEQSFAWVHVDDLVALAADVAAACRSVGVALEDRPYRPHLTLRRGRDLDAGPLAGYAGPAFRVGSFALLESRGGQHAEVVRVVLQEPADPVSKP